MPPRWPLPDVAGRSAATVLALLAAWLFYGHRAQAEPLPDGAFVRARGAEFFVGDRPFRFVGANLDPLHGDTNRAAYREILAALAADGLTVGRVWALGEDLDSAGPWLRQYALFRAGPDGFIEASYEQLDRVLAAARQLGLRLVITLSNHWADWGGAPMYLRWAGKSADGLGFEDFYRDSRTREYFQKGLLRLLERRNSVTGTRYVDDPAIFAWELMNESTVLTPDGREARLGWIRDMARIIHAHDQNHLVAAGLLGYGQLREREEWIRVHKLAEVDYCDSHLYLQNGEGGVSMERMYDLLDDRAQLARFVIGKPLVIGEFGFRTDGPPSYLGRPRAEWFAQFLARHFRNQGAGALVWIYQPFSGKPRDYGVYTDRKDTDDVRSVLRRAAQSLASGPTAQLAAFGPPNPRLAAEHGAAPLYEPVVTLSGRPFEAPHRDWTSEKRGELLLAIPPGEFVRARFERAGFWNGGMLSHAYGADAGEFVYRFETPPSAQVPTAVEIEARLSSEWPGAVAPPDGGSEVDLEIDDLFVARFAVPADDGVGERRVVRIYDPRLRERLASGAHTLSFHVRDGERNHGLCIYGGYHGSEPPPAGEFSPILIRYHFGAATDPIQP